MAYIAALLYKWRDRLDPMDDGQAPPANTKERELRLQVTHLKRLVADKALEADFFQGALQKSRGSTPEQHAAWRDGIYDQIRELMSMQGKLSVERTCQVACVSRAGFYRSLQQRNPVEEDMAVRTATQQICIVPETVPVVRRVEATSRNSAY